MPTFLFHPSRCEKVIEPLLGKKALRSIESILEDEGFNWEESLIKYFKFNQGSSITEGDQDIYMGDPAGFLIRFENGFTLYHAGDTGVFSDMKIIGDIYKPELSLLPIGSHFTMDPREATYSTKLLKSKYVIPIHYGTFPVLTGTPEEFLRLMKEVPETKVLVLKPGETVQ